jgi:hypothetical protein
MVALLCFFLRLLASPLRSNSRLEAENAALRQQLIVLQRKVRGRAEFTNGERLFFIQLYRWFPSDRFSCVPHVDAFFLSPSSFTPNSKTPHAKKS